MFWFMNDWGKYGRAYEKIAETLSSQSEIKHVLCILPPGQVSQGEYAWPFTFSKKSEKLIVLSQNTRLVPTQSAPYRLRQWINRVMPDTLFSLLLRVLGLTRKNTFLWLFPPHPYIDKINSTVPHSKLIVQIVDNNAFLDSAPEDYRQFTKNQYNQLTAQADDIIVSSEMNYRIFSSVSRRCHLFENAVDSVFLSKPTDLPSRINKAQPRIGYVGWITERTDLKLLIWLAKHKQEYRIVVAGPVVSVDQEDISELASLPNIDLLGEIPYQSVPNLLQSLMFA